MARSGYCPGSIKPSEGKPLPRSLASQRVTSQPKNDREENPAMKWTRSSWLTTLWLSALLLSTACTGGLVTDGGDAVVGADVEIWTCESIGGFQTQTDRDGIYSFNPFLANSQDLDFDAFVPPGPIAIVVTDGGQVTFKRRQHQYDGTCPLPYNGGTEQLPCRVQNVALAPLNLVQFLEQSIAFLEQDCGLSSAVAKRLGSAAVRQGTRPLSLTTEPPAASCLSECSASCQVGTAPMAEFQICMCICVEGNCGAQFGPFCTESAG